MDKNFPSKIETPSDPSHKLITEMLALKMDSHIVAIPAALVPRLVEQHFHLGLASDSSAHSVVRFQRLECGLILDPRVLCVPIAQQMTGSIALVSGVPVLAAHGLPRVGVGIPGLKPTLTRLFHRFTQTHCQCNETTN